MKEEDANKDIKAEEDDTKPKGLPPSLEEILANKKAEIEEESKVEIPNINIFISKYSKKI